MKRKPIYQSIPTDKLSRGRYQPRVVFDPEKLAELAASIRSAGLLQPIVVRPIRDYADSYEIIAGERRWRAAQIAGLSEVDCLIHPFTDDEAAEATTIENINRVDLNPIEEARAYARLIEEFHYIHEEIASAVGRSRSAITNSLRLLKLVPTVQQMLIDKDLSEGHGKMIASLRPEQQLPLAREVISKNWTVRKLERAVQDLQKTGRITKQSEKRPPDLAHLERQLSNHLGARTRIDFSSGSGKLQIDFHNLEVFDGLLKKMGMGEKET